MNENPKMAHADENAALWLFRHDVGLSVQETQEFADWLASSDENTAAWVRANAVLDSIGLDDDPFLDAMRTDALAARPRRFSASRIARVAISGAAALVVGTIGVLSWQSMDHGRPLGGSSPVVVASTVSNYETAGDVRTVQLPDGSQAILNRQTHLTIAFSDRRRDLRVVRGEALFDVRHDGRGFVVRGGDTTVTATGTRFAVRVLPRSVVATLERGSVTVGRDGDARTVALVPGQQLVSTVGKPMQVSDANPEATLPWVVTYERFNDTPLDVAVARMSAHSKRPMRAVGQAAHLLISGRFRSDDPDGFIVAVTMTLPVRQRRAKDGAIELVGRR
ncbi:FecR family protein [Sphingomonas faeni]|uniref:FecR family protein n=1 Tax=Sphingomonas faeni TaxID=185950 RepID=UPI00336132BA